MINSVLSYKGFLAYYDYVQDEDGYYGQVIGVPDAVITFQSQHKSDIIQAFKDSVDDYLEFCAELA